MSSPSKTSKKDAEQQQKAGPLRLLHRAVTEQNEEWDKEELLDIIHWQRQLLAIACGLVWGLIPLTGIWAFVGFIGLNVGSVLAWWRSQRIDEDEYGGVQALMGEGLPPSIGLFLCVWVLTFTAMSSSS